MNFKKNLLILATLGLSLSMPSVWAYYCTGTFKNNADIPVQILWHPQGGYSDQWVSFHQGECSVDYNGNLVGSAIANPNQSVPICYHTDSSENLNGWIQFPLNEDDNTTGAPGYGTAGCASLHSGSAAGIFTDQAGQSENITFAISGGDITASKTSAAPKK